MKTVWIDLLCLSSAAKVIKLLRHEQINKVYYINIAKFFSPFIEKFKNMINVPLIQVDWIAQGEEKIGDTCLYEATQIRLTQVLNGWVAQDNIAKRINDFCTEHEYNPVKFKEHLKEKAYPHVFRAVEIMVISEKISGADSSIYMIRKSPFSKLLAETLGEDRVIFYKTLLSQRLATIKREDYHYDEAFNKKYYSDRIMAISHNYLFWLSTTINIIIYSLWKTIMRIKDENEKTDTNIGVEFLQKRVDMDEINDIYWLRDCGIDPATICSIEMRDYDSDSNKTLSDLKIKRYRLCSKPQEVIKLIASILSKKDPRRPLLPFIKYSLSTALNIFPLFLFMFLWNESSWLRYQEMSFICDTRLWESIYRRLNIRIVWTMSDSGAYKLSKAQALENLDGLYIGAHWSNYTMCRVDNKKCYDVLFAWSEYFIKNIFNQYPFMATFKTGYPLDYYFESKNGKAKDLRSKYPDKFILSFQDNAMGQDLLYTKGIHLQAYRMLISLMKNNDNLAVFLKPKRKNSVDKMREELPELDRYINEKRIVVFSEDTPFAKASPALIGMASDLVIGLGLSTAAAECFFAGTVGFHTDFNGLMRNEFGKKGLNKIVFPDIASLENAIIQRMKGEDNRSCNEYRQYYEMLDPFQDGKAYLRTGFVIKKLQEALSSGMHRDEAVKYAVKEYDKSFGHVHSV